MNEKTLVGYHATSKENIDLIVKDGFIESKPSKGHWLGKGIYLFENLYYAIEWEILGVIKYDISDYNIIKNTCGILKIDLDIENYKVIDFSEPQGYIIFERLLQIIKGYYSEEEYDKIVSKGYAYIIKIIENLEKQSKGKYISRFDIVCAVYPKYIKRPKTSIPGDFIPCVQKQICIKNKKAIKNIIELNHDDNTEELFNLIIYNRGDKND